MSYFVQELLRFDSPAWFVFNTTTKEDIQIDEVKILKGTDVSYNVHALHNNPDQWQSPEKFIPERFDPTSKYYLTPNGTARNFFSYGPFGFGIR